MIALRNTQRTVPIDIVAFSRDAQSMLDALDYGDYDLGIWITNDKTIRTYNRLYRHKDVATDILSFAYHSTLKAGQRIKPKDPEDKNLGDLIISAPYVAARLTEYGTTLPKRLRILLAHGICHLLGYDHIEDTDWRKMRAKESYLLKKVQQLDGSPR